MSSRAWQRWFPCYQWVWFPSDRAPAHEEVALSSNRAALSVGMVVYPSIMEDLFPLFYHHHSPKSMALSLLPVFAAPVSWSGGVARYSGNLQSHTAVSSQFCFSILWSFNTGPKLWRDIFVNNSWENHQNSAVHWQQDRPWCCWQWYWQGEGMYSMG